jgi:hypothetical protein
MDLLIRLREWGRRSGDTTTTPAGRFWVVEAARPTRFNEGLTVWLLIQQGPPEASQYL